MKTISIFLLIIGLTGLAWLAVHNSVQPYFMLDVILSPKLLRESTREERLMIVQNIRAENLPHTAESVLPPRLLELATRDEKDVVASKINHQWAPGMLSWLTAGAMALVGAVGVWRTNANPFVQK